MDKKVIYIYIYIYNIIYIYIYIYNIIYIIYIYIYIHSTVDFSKKKWNGSEATLVWIKILRKNEKKIIPRMKKKFIMLISCVAIGCTKRQGKSNED